MTAAVREAKTLDVDGVTLSWVEVGEGEPLVLTHGSGPGLAGYWSYRAVVNELASRFRLYILDMPGYGDSAPLPDADTPANVAVRLLRWLDLVGLERVHLAGHSRGGRIACELTVLAPDRVRRLVIVGAGSVAPGGHVDAEGGWTGPALALVNWGVDGDLSYESFRQAYLSQVVRAENLRDDWLREAYAEAQSRDGLNHFVKTMAANDPLRYYHQTNAEEFTQKLAALSTPTLVLWGREDRCSPYQKAIPLLDLMQDVQLTVIPDCDHFITLDQPEVFAGVVLEFLTRDDARSGFKPHEQYRQANPRPEESEI